MDTTFLTKTLSVQGETCEVFPRKDGKTWKASGTYKSQPICGQGARTAEKAFEYWQNRAEMVADSIFGK